MKAARTAVAAAATAGVVLSLALTVPAAHAEDYPSWSDVQAAKANQAATQAEVEKITSLIGSLQTKAARLGGIAVKRAADYAQAKQELAEATAKADRLASQHEAAEAKARAARKRVGTLTGELYRARTVGTSLHLFLSGDDAGNLLYKLGAISKLTSTASMLRQTAQAQDNLAKSLSEQAASARAARDRLAAEAEKAAQAAQAAADAADAELAKQKQVASTLYAQLASLKNTTAQVEERYREGVRAREAYEQQAAASAAAQGGGGSTETAPPPSGMIVDPGAAQAYARSRMGAYGWGSGQFQCLVWLWNQESGWRADAYNTSSGAYGIPQSLPGSKMASAGADWRTNAATQINWGLGYIAARYGSPCGAWDHETSHNWY